MSDIGDIQTYSPRWQCIVLLFAVLNEIRGGLTKADSIGRIYERGWFDTQPEDMLPYPSNRLTSREHRWKTIIAWARKDAVENHFMERGVVNNWDLESTGRDIFAAIAKACRESRLDVRRCYLWSKIFKHRMDPTYTPGQPERRRPINLYQGDWVLRNLDLF